MSNKANILLMTLRADLSGGPKHVRDQLSYLRSVEDLNIFIAAPEHDYFSAYYKENSESFFALGHRSFSLVVFLKLVMFCRSKGIKIVHSHGRGAGIYARGLALFGIKVIHTFHGIHKEPSLIGSLKYYFDFYSKHLISHNICVSKNEFDKAIDLKLSRLDNTSLVENGIDTKEITKALNESDYVDYRNKLNIEDDAIVLGTVTRNDPVKGVNYLINNFIYFRDIFPHIKIVLLVAGDGFESFNNDGVYFLGQIDNPVYLYRSIDFYVSNSLKEGMPLSVLEAMYCNVPCLLSRIVGHVDLVEDGNTGLLYELDDNSSFTEKLTELLKIGGKDLAGNAYNRVNQRHTLKKMSEATADIYRTWLQH